MQKRRDSMPNGLRKKLCNYNLWKVYSDLPYCFSNSEKMEFENAYLRSAVDVVRYSFIAQKSVTYLDLSVGEYGKLEKHCNTKDSYKNKVLNYRNVLYSYHLDVSKKLDDNISKLDETLYKLSFKCFYLKDVFVDDVSVYKLEKYDKSFVKIAVQKSNNKIRTLMKCIEFLNVPTYVLRTNFIPYLELIIEERGDSELVCQFLQNFPYLIRKFFVSPYNPALVDFVLYHTTRAKCRIFNEELDTRHLVFSANYKYFYQLIKYGYNYPFLPGDFLRHVRNYFVYHNGQEVSTDIFYSYRRQNIFILTTLFWFPNKMDPPIDLVKLLWQAIPDPFFTRVEISQACDKLHVFPENYEKLIYLYESRISSGLLEKPIPRSLCHLCRCSIREHMGSLFQLPHGIDKLILPETLKRYLRLNIPHEHI